MNTTAIKGAPLQAVNKHSQLNIPTLGLTHAYRPIRPCANAHAELFWTRFMCSPDVESAGCICVRILQGERPEQGLVGSAVKELVGTALLEYARLEEQQLEQNDANLQAETESRFTELHAAFTHIQGESGTNSSSLFSGPARSHVVGAVDMGIFVFNATLEPGAGVDSATYSCADKIL